MDFKDKTRDIKRIFINIWKNKRILDKEKNLKT